MNTRRSKIALLVLFYKGTCTFMRHSIFKNAGGRHIQRCDISGAMYAISCEVSWLCGAGKGTMLLAMPLDSCWSVVGGQLSEFLALLEPLVYTYTDAGQCDDANMPEVEPHANTDAAHHCRRLLLL